MPDTDRIITPDEVHGAPRRTGRFWFDFLAASAAIFISVISLVIGIRGEAIQRELLAANSWPFLEMDVERHVSEAGAGMDTINIGNEGVGPAKVESFEVFYRGKPVGSVTELLQRCCGFDGAATGANEQRMSGISIGDVSGNVIRPDRSRTMFSIDRRHADTAVFDKFDAHLADITMRLCYCSILDRCWLTNLRTLKPPEVASCPLPAHPFSMISLGSP